VANYITARATSSSNHFTRPWWANIFCARVRPEYIPAIAPLFKNILKEWEISVNWVFGFWAANNIEFTQSLEAVDGGAASLDLRWIDAERMWCIGVGNTKVVGCILGMGSEVV
jgi:hypothetical protein